MHILRKVWLECVFVLKRALMTALLSVMMVAACAFDVCLLKCHHPASSASKEEVAIYRSLFRPFHGPSLQHTHAAAPHRCRRQKAPRL